MLDLNIINKNAIIICPNSLKMQLMPLFNDTLEHSIKYISKEELISSLSFSYDDNALLYLINKNYSFDNSLEILKNLNFVVPGSVTLDKLTEIKIELEKEKLLKRNEIFKNIFTNKTVYIYGYSKLDKEITNLLDSASISYSYLEEENNNFTHKIYEFERMEDEVLYVFEKICEYKKNKVEVENICIYKYPSEYDTILRKYAKLFNVPINFPSNIHLNEVPLFKKFISLTKLKSIEESFLDIKDEIDRYNSVSSLISIINDILELNTSKEIKIQLIIDKAKRVQLNEDKYLNGINIVDEYYRGTSYIFMLGFSLGNYPKIKKDTDFLLDFEKEKCGLNTSKTMNMINEELIENFITNNKNIIITSKKKTEEKRYFPSLLIDKLNLKKVDGERGETRYSEKLFNLEVAEYQDFMEPKKFDTLYNPYYQSRLNNFKYKIFKHEFKEFEEVKNLDKFYKISFSQIDDYAKCPFMYYVKRICNIDEFEETLYLKIGNLFHDILLDSLTKEVKKEDYQNRINEEFVTHKELYFANKLVDHAFKVVQKNKAFNEITSFKSSYGEQVLEFMIDEKTKLYGKADKIMINDIDKEAIIIDYKTGSTSFDKKLIPFSLSLQLPIYGALINKCYPEYSPIGMYIQHVIEKESDETKRYKLQGISIFDSEILSHLEHGLSGYSNYVTGLRVTSNGYQGYTGFYKKEEFNEIIKSSLDKVKENVEKIRNGEFPIHPLSIDGNDQACKYCPFKAICFVEQDDRNNKFRNKLDVEEGLEDGNE